MGAARSRPLGRQALALARRRQELARRAAIRYPEGARYLQGYVPREEAGPDQQKRRVYKPATLLKLWFMAFGPPARLCVGTIPGGLFVSSDGGESFELNRSLWNHASRGGAGLLDAG